MYVSIIKRRKTRGHEIPWKTPPRAKHLHAPDLSTRWRRRLSPTLNASPSWLQGMTCYFWINVLSLLMVSLSLSLFLSSSLCQSKWLTVWAVAAFTEQSTEVDHIEEDAIRLKIMCHLPVGKRECKTSDTAKAQSFFLLFLRHVIFA